MVGGCSEMDSFLRVVKPTAEKSPSTTLWVFTLRGGIGQDPNPRLTVRCGGSATSETIGGDSVKAYVLTTGILFGLLTLAHLWRVLEEGPGLATNPWYVLITLVAAALCVWAFRLLRIMTRG
jgi:hypothetical protein